MTELDNSSLIVTGTKVLFMKFYFQLIILFIGSSIYAQQTEIKFLSGTDAANTVEWDFFCTDGKNSGEWGKINVPSNWELQGFWYL